VWAGPATPAKWHEPEWIKAKRKKSDLLPRLLQRTKQREDFLKLDFGVDSRE
jgi:hypothetical protein